MSDERMPAWAQSLMNEMVDMRADLGAVRADLGAVRADLGGQIDRTRADLGAVRADLGGQIDRTRSDIMARIDRLQDALTQQQDESRVNFGAAERAERIALGVREETRALGDQVTALRRMVQRLQSRLDGLEGGRP